MLQFLPGGDLLTNKLLGANKKLLWNFLYNSREKIFASEAHFLNIIICPKRISQRKNQIN